MIVPANFNIFPKCQKEPTVNSSIFQDEGRFQGLSGPKR